MVNVYRNALVTGASSGIGRALARGLAAQGCRVVLCARRQAELSQAAWEIREKGGTAEILELDVADTGAAVAAIRGIDARLGGLDLVIANAGIGVTRRGASLKWEDISLMCQVNFSGAIATLTAVLPEMVRRGSGHLVGVSSLGAFTAYPGGAAYCATKAGLSMFLDALRMDLGQSGVRVTCVQPGFVRTEMTAKNRGPMPFAMEADEAAALILGALPKAPRTIDFPLPTALGARLFGAMPRALRDLLMRRAKVGA